jgi:hypothetical protein
MALSIYEVCKNIIHRGLPAEIDAPARCRTSRKGRRDLSNKAPGSN